MKRLILLRHAKSGWDDPVARDYDRPLNPRGRAAAAVIGQWASTHIFGPNGLMVDSIIASPAVRCSETLDLFQPAAGLATIEPHWDRRIYLASSATLIDVLCDLPDHITTALMCGHNPGMEDLILDLVPDDGTSPDRDIAEEQFPTAALAMIEMDIGHWADVQNRCGRLAQFKRPRDVDTAFGPEDD
ncbi:MAG: histidine phosphatase family protein [Sphingopyxis sp.]